MQSTTTTPTAAPATDTPPAPKKKTVEERLDMIEKRLAPLVGPFDDTEPTPPPAP